MRSEICKSQFCVVKCVKKHFALSAVNYVEVNSALRAVKCVKKHSSLSAVKFISSHSALRAVKYIHISPFCVTRSEMCEKPFCAKRSKIYNKLFCAVRSMLQQGAFCILYLKSFFYLSVDFLKYLLLLSIT